jgi:hypothetical protein
MGIQGFLYKVVAERHCDTAQTPFHLSHWRRNQPSQNHGTTNTPVLPLALQWVFSILLAIMLFSWPYQKDPFPSLHQLQGCICSINYFRLFLISSG